MKPLDYLRFSLAGIKIHKKRTTKIVFLTGLIFMVITTITFILQGTENTILKNMTSAMDGRIVVKTSIDPDYCVKPCNNNENIKQIKDNIQTYRGKILNTTNITIDNQVFYKFEELKDSKNTANPDQTDISIPSISAPIETILELVDIKIQNPNTQNSSKVSFIKEVVDSTLHKVITTKSGKKVYVSDIYPSNFFSHNLTQPDVNQNQYPLDMISNQIYSTKSLNIIQNNKDSFSNTNNMAAPTSENKNTTEVFALFEDILSASNYFHDKQNYCTRIRYALGSCGEDYRYHIESVISDPINTYEKFNEFWSVFRLAVTILSIILIIVTTSTYTRIIAKDKQIISIYKSMYATKRQITTIFTLQLFIICLITIIFSIALSFVFTLIFNAINMENIQNALTVGLSTKVNDVFIFGWNNIILIPIYGLIVSVVLTILLNNQSLYPKR